MGYMNEWRVVINYCNNKWNYILVEGRAHIVLEIKTQKSFHRCDIICAIPVIKFGKWLYCFGYHQIAKLYTSFISQIYNLLKLKNYPCFPCIYKSTKIFNPIHPTNLYNLINFYIQPNPYVLLLLSLSPHKLLLPDYYYYHSPSLPLLMRNCRT
jgi:hypothetical protein